MELQLVDAHVHLWDLGRLTYPWLNEIPEINQSFDLEAFQGQTAGLNVESMIFVQCECLPTEYRDEIDYITQLAAIDRRIQGIVAWFPLEAENAEEGLEELLRNPLLKGIRRLEESPTSLYKNHTFLRNLHLLGKHQLTFDICTKHSLLEPAIHMVERQPEVKFMLDHMGKPDIRNREMQSWKTNIRRLAQNPNVYCKVSGLVTEADLHRWQVDDLRPYFDFALEQFGIDRLVFGSDWPVLTLATSYQQWFATARELCSGFSYEDIHKLFYSNACAFYRLAEKPPGYKAVSRLDRPV